MGKNDITGDNLTSKAPNKAYDDGWDRIFGKKKTKEAHAEEFNGERADWYGYSDTDEESELSSEFAHPAYTRYPHLKNQKMKQKAMTELNYDGNEDRGRYGEDESNG